MVYEPLIVLWTQVTMCRILRSGKYFIKEAFDSGRYAGVREACQTIAYKTTLANYYFFRKVDHNGHNR